MHDCEITYCFLRDLNSSYWWEKRTLIGLFYIVTAIVQRVRAATGTSPSQPGPGVSKGLWDLLP